MIDGDQIAALVFLAMALTLAVANLHGRRLPISRMATMALSWVFMIAGVSLLFARIGAHSPDYAGFNLT
ncbi:MAG: hypothetical protein ABIU18_04200 [Novosphingobium sp.]